MVLVAVVSWHAISQITNDIHGVSFLSKKQNCSLLFMCFLQSLTIQHLNWQDNFGDFLLLVYLIILTYICLFFYFLCDAIYTAFVIVRLRINMMKKKIKQEKLFSLMIWRRRVKGEEAENEYSEYLLLI